MQFWPINFYAVRNYDQFFFYFSWTWSRSNWALRSRRFLFCHYHFLAYHVNVATYTYNYTIYVLCLKLYRCPPSFGLSATVYLSYLLFFFFFFFSFFSLYLFSLLLCFGFYLTVCALMTLSTISLRNILLCCFLPLSWAMFIHHLTFSILSLLYLLVLILLLSAWIVHQPFLSYISFTGLAPKVFDIYSPLVNTSRSIVYLASHSYELWSPLIIRLFF